MKKNRNELSKNNRPFLRIPLDVANDNELDTGARLLYGRIEALSHQRGYCYAGNHALAKYFGVSKATICRWIASLVEKGFIESTVDKMAGNKRRIYPIEPRIIHADTPSIIDEDRSDHLVVDPIVINEISNGDECADPLLTNDEHNKNNIIRESNKNIFNKKNEATATATPEVKDEPTTAEKKNDSEIPLYTLHNPMADLQEEVEDLLCQEGIELTLDDAAKVLVWFCTTLTGVNTLFIPQKTKSFMQLMEDGVPFSDFIQAMWAMHHNDFYTGGGPTGWHWDLEFITKQGNEGKKSIEKALYQTIDKEPTQAEIDLLNKIGFLLPDTFRFKAKVDQNKYEDE